ncbi:uncharacterized protein LOC129287573 [Prosopis cineraria]|uniref:uncharacterized protein LOC129287573 n=1 Tax=Prosopis cineraria TaxID=364024 RepID=UPI00240F7458|nr:uncharacterized protein LOC129287573 [Prosopis cineraria]XP_054779753.1 uncharacterized protein LOC129287573 [Prosopis cineraria]XP_054779754.1 uncharacterized protein LOC129287573 [Prosopis cineraria]XP_054779755.1 uncharacterized protein LOC129287573 [Prosopis cineraria]
MLFIVGLGTQVEVLITGPELMHPFGNMFKVDTTYMITNLVVHDRGQLIHKKYHLRILDMTRVDETVIEEPICNGRARKEGASDLNDIDDLTRLNDMTASQIVAPIAVPTTVNMKGKRKYAPRRFVAIDETTKPPQVHVPSVPKQVKAIKQEKK